VKLTTLLLTFLLAATAAFAQAKSSPSLPVVGEKYDGTYEGTVKGQPVVLELKTKGGNFEGSLKLGEKTYKLEEGTFTDGMLSLGFDKDLKLVGKPQGDKIVGDLTVGTEKSPVELKTVVPAAATTAATPATTASNFNPSGEWEAVADANGQPFPFFLTLKVDGEKVSGGSSSQLGEGTIKDGTWKDGKLVFQIDGTNGAIAMTATVVDGKLSGEFDYAGQLSGKWVAVRKNP
jgi:hypothetical protein